MSKSKIEWTDRVWNPVTGCTKISAGCANCYAEAYAKRFWGERKFTDVRCHEDRLKQPFVWKKPCKVFVNSMSDLFHDSVPLDFIYKVFLTIAANPQHTFQILTKRPDRAFAFLGFLSIWHKDFEMPGNIWFGTTVENSDNLCRIKYLLKFPASVRFLSIEPMLSSIDLTNMPFPDNSNDVYDALSGWGYSCLGSGACCELPWGKIDWVICGGESGRNARPMHPDWVRSLRDQCAEANVPFFFKQWGEYQILYERSNPPKFTFEEEYFKYNRINISGGQDSHGGNLCYYKKVGKTKAGRLLDGKEYKEFPGVK